MLRHQPRAGRAAAGLDRRRSRESDHRAIEPGSGSGMACGITPSRRLARDLRLTIKTRSRAQKTLDELLLRPVRSRPTSKATAPGIPGSRTDRKNILAKVERLVAQFIDTGLVAQAAIAPTPDASLLGAHLAKPVLQIDHAQDFLAPLPIETFTLA